MKTSLLLFLVVAAIVAGLVCLRGQSATNPPEGNLPTAKTTLPKPASPEKVPAISSTPDKPQAFGYKCFWLAIHNENAGTIMDALKLKNRQPANWASGIRQAYGLKKVFVTPPVQGWTLVAGLALPDAGDARHPDRCTPLLRDLSRQLGQVQYFGTHRVVEYHAWAKAENGAITRAYAYVGEEGVTLWNIGPKTPEEKALGFAFDDSKSRKVEHQSKTG